MLSRAFKISIRKANDKDFSDGSKCSSSSAQEYEDTLVGFMEDKPLISCGDHRARGRPLLTLKEVLRSSVGVMGESPLGMTEKAVLLRGEVCAVKRFRMVTVGRSEFGRRVERLARISGKCQYLVPVTAYLYSKRIKFVVCDYYPMGSLADLLAGGRRRGHTAMNWNQRLTIILHTARAIAFIHAQQSPPNQKTMKLNVHGNIKPSNVMINVDFTARLSDYGFLQLAKCVDGNDSRQQNSPDHDEFSCCDDNQSEQSDIYNFGLIMLDILGGVKSPALVKSIAKRREDIKEGSVEFFEFSVEEKERVQVMGVLNIALACTNKIAEARPSIDQIMLNLNDVLSNSDQYICV